MREHDSLREGEVKDRENTKRLGGKERDIKGHPQKRKGRERAAHETEFGWQNNLKKWIRTKEEN